MKPTVLAALALAALLPAVPAPGAGKPEEDPTLPRPPKGQPLEYYRSLAHVHATYRLFEAAAELQLRAIELAEDKANKERLSLELFDRIYCRAKQWDKAAAEILRTIRLVEKGNTVQERKYRMARARVLAEAGRMDEYIRELERVAQLSVTGEAKERALLSLHMALKKLDKLQAKIDEYEAAVKRDPKDELTLRILAGIYHGSGLLNLPGRAIRKYEQIRAFRPDDIAACKLLAELYV